jgi:hypothetical protein
MRLHQLRSRPLSTIGLVFGAAATATAAVIGIRFAIRKYKESVDRHAEASTPIDLDVSRFDAEGGAMMPVTPLADDAGMSA